MKFIYALVDPRTSAVRYIGKSSEQQSRTLARHIRDGRTAKTAKAKWVAKLLKHGLQPRLTVIESSGEWTTQEHNMREIHWIAHYGRIPNGPLLNLTDGGDGGPCAIGHKWSPERRRKIEKFFAERTRLHPPMIRRVEFGFRQARKPRPRKQPNRRPNGTQWATACSVCGAAITAMRQKTCGASACRSQVLKTKRAKPAECVQCGYVAKSVAGLAAHARRHINSRAKQRKADLRRAEQ